MFVGYIGMTKHYHYLEPKTSREYYKSNVVFHEFTPYYRKLQKLSPLVEVGEKRSESKSKQKHEHIQIMPRLAA